MFSADAYQLIDFGEGRRLERFGGLSLDRPCPTVEGVPKSNTAAWAAADARFERTTATEGKWIAARDLPERWTIAHGPIALELKRTEFGHLGVFPEQAANWDWIAAQVRAASRPLHVLNLFAHTAGSTLAAAAAGANVVHVDAARNVVAWGRRNAELSGMAEAPIRWIAEDTMKFAGRELRRQSHYDAVILDPPSFGRGPRGEVWQLSKHLPRLLSLCAQLTAGQPQFVLLTCHTPDFTPDRLKGMVLETLGAACPGRITSCPLTLTTSAGRELPSGVAVRWEAAMEP
jgi:23S rRNA (cytosine1962-C5)-methyltransferase